MFSVPVIIILILFCWLLTEILDLHRAWRISSGIMTIITGVVVARCYFEVLQISDNIHTSSTVYWFVDSSLKCL